MVYFRSDNTVHPAGVAAAAGVAGTHPAILWAAHPGSGAGKALHGGLGLARSGEESIHSYS